MHLASVGTWDITLRSSFVLLPINDSRAGVGTPRVYHGKGVSAVDILDFQCLYDLFTHQRSTELSYYSPHYVNSGNKATSLHRLVVPERAVKDVVEIFSCQREKTRN